MIDPALQTALRAALGMLMLAAASHKLRDFAAFQSCFAGVGVAYADAGCAVFDVDTDGDVDEIDFVALRVLFTGTLVGPP